MDTKSTEHTARVSCERTFCSPPRVSRVGCQREIHTSLTTAISTGVSLCIIKSNDGKIKFAGRTMGRKDTGSCGDSDKSSEGPRDSKDIYIYTYICSAARVSAHARIRPSESSDLTAGRARASTIKSEADRFRPWLARTHLLRIPRKKTPARTPPARVYILFSNLPLSPGARTHIRVPEIYSVSLRCLFVINRLQARSYEPQLVRQLATVRKLLRVSSTLSP